MPTRPLDSVRIHELAKGAEQILGNYDRVTSESAYQEFVVGTRAWVKVNLRDRGYQALMSYLREQIQYTSNDPDRQMAIFKKKAWPLFELESISPVWSYEGWLRARREWKQQMDAALHALPEVGVWLDKLRKDKKRDLKPQFMEDSEQNVSIDGFHMIFHEYDEEDPSQRTFADQLTGAIKDYQQRARRYLPVMLKHKLPMDVMFGSKSSSGNYGDGRITLHQKAMRDRDKIVYTIAHETGHYFGLDWMPHNARAFWIAAVKQDMAPIKLSALLAKWPKSQPHFNLWMLESRDSDPVLHMQLEAMWQEHVKMPKAFVDADDWTREGLARYIEQHGDSELRMMHTPITPYANANPDEAFAEAVALLVAYGPQAVHAQARKWLNIVLPGEIKVAVDEDKALTRFAAVVSLDSPTIEKLRKDVLALLKNIPKIHTQEDAQAVANACKVFRKKFNTLFFEHFLNRDLKYEDNGLSESDRTYIGGKLRKSGWDLYLALEMPMYGVDAFYRFQEEKVRWSNRVKVKARAFWNDFDESLEYYERVTKNQGFPVKVPNEDQTTVEGFKVKIVGWGQDSTSEADLTDHFARFKEGLKIFRRRAGQTLPMMLKVMLPLTVYAYLRKLDEGGSYEVDHIDIALRAATKNPASMAHLVAHEMGHHLYLTYLSKADREFWDTAIRGNYGPLDVEKALRLWPSGAWLFDMPQHMKEIDPTLAVQLQVLSQQGGQRGPQTKEEFQKALAAGETFTVPINPISGYAAKNTEEAFCEAIGFLVGYGPRTVDPLVLSWLQMILPSVRTAAHHSPAENEVIVPKTFRVPTETIQLAALKVAARHQAASAPVAVKVAARFKEKKQVPKANGKGKTTVYVYSEGQVDKRNKEKAKRLQEFKPKVEKLRAKVKTDLKSKDDDVRLTALVVALIDETHERVGSPASSKGDLNDDGEAHFGVSEWLKKHVTLSEGKATIRYVGKSGVDQEKDVTTPHVLSALRDAVNAAEGKESRLFESVTGEKVNAYLKEFAVSAKDIRGLSANSLCQKALKRIRSKGGKLPEDKKEREKQLKEEFKAALDEVSADLGHEASTLKSQYLAPNMEPSYLKDGTVIEKLSD